MKNKNIQKWLTDFMFVVFSIAIIGWTASLTLGVMEVVLPRSPYVKYFALALFDGGALTWLFVYIYKAKGTPQRAISMLVTTVDFLGIVLMVIGAIYLSGQSLAAIPSWMGQALINGTIGVTIFNLGMVYLYHANAPETREAIQAQDLEDEIHEKGMEIARANVEREALRLGTIMAARATARLKYRLRLPMTEQELAEWNGETIDAETVDAPALPLPHRLTFWDMLKSFFGRGRFTPSPAMQPSVNSTETSTNSPDQPSQQEPPTE